MKRIYKENDIVFNLAVNDFPYSSDVIKGIEFKFYTINTENYFKKTKADINENGELLLEWKDLSLLEQGVLYYDYKVSVSDENMGDGSFDTVDKQMTNYYIMTGKQELDVVVTSTKWGDISGNLTHQADLVNYINIKISEVDHLDNYYSKEDIDKKGYLTEHQNISHLATKEELNGKVNNDAIADMLTKTEAAQTYLTEVPTEFVTEEELAAKGYLTEHQDISKLATKEELKTKSDVGHKHDEYLTSVALDSYYTKNQIDGKGYLTSIPAQYVTEQELELKGYISSIPSNYVTDAKLEAKGYLTEHQSLANYATKADLNNKADNTAISDMETKTHAALTYLTQKDIAGKVDKTEADKLYLTAKDILPKLDKSEAIKKYQPIGDYADKQYLATNYYNQTQVNQKISESLGDKINIDDYYKKSEVYSRLEIDGKGYLTSIPFEYVTRDYLKEKGYLTEVPLEYVTQSEMEAEHYLKKIPDGYVTQGDLKEKNYVTDSQLTNNYYDKTKVYTKYEIGQLNYLTSDRLKTINGQSIVGDGDITIEGGSGGGTVVAGVSSVNGKTGAVTISASDLNAYTMSQIDNKHFLTEHQKIKTINNQSILGEGNITIEGGSADLTNYYNKDEINGKLSNKLDTTVAAQTYVTNDALNGKGYLTEHQELKTINGQSLIGSGNITIQGSEGGGTVVAGVNTVNGKSGDVTITAADLNCYTKGEIDGKGYLTNSDMNGYVTDEELEQKITTISSGVKRVDITQAEYNQLPTKDTNTLYYISDATAAEYATADDLSKKADKTELPNMQLYYTSAQIDELIGGVNDKINEINTMI